MLRVVFIVLCIVAFASKNMVAQELVPAIGKVEIIQDDRITQLTEQYKKMSTNNQEVEGYRVQIFFDSGSNSKNKAASVKEEFTAIYPEVKSYLSYKEPYYRVRAGNFRSLTEAVGFQKKIASDFPNSFPVKDNIVP